MTGSWNKEPVVGRDERVILGACEYVQEIWNKRPSIPSFIDPFVSVERIRNKNLKLISKRTNQFTSVEVHDDRPGPVT